MKVHLMYEDRDFDNERKITPQEQVLAQDLELDTLFGAMANGNEFVAGVVQRAVFSSLDKTEDILYRQAIVKDCIKNREVVRSLYDIANEAIKRKREQWWGGYSRYLSSILSSSVDLLRVLAGMLKRLRKVADEHAGQFESKGFARLFSMLREELDDEYFSTVEAHLNELKFQDGVLISAELGEYNQGVRYTLRRPQNTKHRWLKWYFAPSLYIHPRDDSGCTDLSKRKDRALNLAANALAQSVEHVAGFFALLQSELAFYIGCLNLYERLSEKGEPVSFPLPFGRRERRHSFSGLYDVSLALLTGKKVMGNRIDADGKDLVIITGANQGGKSTFLRSIGQAQLMMQCGMFVPAESFSANVCDGVFTHYKKEEDASMKSGKLDEELERMSGIADRVKPDSMVLFNESFAATNEREGSEIGRQIVRALLENQIKIFIVTHLYDFSKSFYEQNMDRALFLRAERQADGSRTFRLVEGEPLVTSFGEDIYSKVFQSDGSL